MFKTIQSTHKFVKCSQIFTETDLRSIFDGWNTRERIFVTLPIKLENVVYAGKVFFLQIHREIFFLIFEHFII